MKKKNTLFKTIAIIFFILVVLSWIIPTSRVSGTEVISSDLARVSLHQIFEYPWAGPQAAAKTVLFILAVGGFYGVLGITGKYRNCLEKIAKSMKGKEELFLVVISALFVILSSVFGLDILLFIFIPAIISIILLLGYDKLTAYLIGFISPLIGIIGSTYSAYIAGYTNQLFSLTYKNGLLTKIALLVICFVVFIAFTLKHARKVLNKNNDKDTYDYLGEKTQSKKPSWPLYVIFGLLLVLLIVGYTDWEGVFGITFFTDLHTNIQEFTIKDVTVLKYLFDGTEQLGKWTIDSYTFILILSTFIISLIYNIKLDDSLEAYANGIKKSLKSAALVGFAYCVVFIAFYHGYIVTILDFISNTCGFGLAKLVNITWLQEIIHLVFASLSTMISTLMNIDYLYLASTVGTFMSTAYADYSLLIGIAMQAIYGLTLIIAPTSTLLILGLTSLDINYKDYLKKIWKLVLELLLVIFVIIILLVIVKSHI